LYRDRTVQHAGVAVNRQDMIPYHMYRGFAETHPAVNSRRELQAVTAACVLIRRSAFDRAGGFDDGYRNGFEDIDLCLKVREQKGRVVYQPKSVLIHLESQTPGRKQHDADNARRFLQRWSHAWWLADEDFHYHTDGFKLMGGDQDVEFATQVQPLTDVRDRAAWAHVAAAQAAALKQDWAAVRRELRLCADWPNDRFVLSWGASVAGHLQESDARIQFLSRYLTLADAPAERLALARTLLERRDFQQAEEHLRALLASSPHDPEALLVNAVLCMQREQYLEAERAFSAALRHGADRRKCLLGMGMAALGRSYAQGAWERFLQVLDEHPDDAEAVHWLLRSGTAQNRWTDLAGRLAPYLSRNPGDLAARFAYASVLVRSERIEAARAELETLRALSPAYDGLDQLAQAIGQKEAAVAMETAHS
jgi:thioredoxin-like negative regulator of GroEL